MRQKNLVSGLLLLMLMMSGCTHSDLYKASSKGEVKKAKTIIQKGANVNQQGEFGLTPLMAAAKANNFKLIKILLANGADINQKDDFRRSALWYAFDYESFDTFRILLENGAQIDFPLNDKTAYTLYKKNKLCSLAKEYRLLNQIRAGNTNPKLFNAYFSEFSDGYYVSEVEKKFEPLLKKDYQKIESSESVAELQRFISKYAKICPYYYVVTAEPLNIRKTPSTGAGIVGEYNKKDKIHSLEEKDGWIRTTRGWVSKTYLKRVRKNLPIVSKYFEKVENKLNRLRQPREKEIRKPETRVRQSMPESEDFIRVRKELESILQNATLRKLEVFIQKYGDNRTYDAITKIAREEYKALLLGN